MTSDILLITKDNNMHDKICSIEFENYIKDKMNNTFLELSSDAEGM